MFNDKQYSEINREERFFCFLFSHSLLMSRQVRGGLAQLANSKLGISLDPDALEVYVEVAALRDYWNDLGSPVVYSEETHAKRRKVLELILNEFQLPASTLDDYDLFWTSVRGGKLWSPSQWSIEELKQAGLEDLIKVRWAFNAKPDILLISPATMVLVEAKLESSEGRKEETGYQQYEIQKLIARLWQLLIPEFSKRSLHITTLEVKPPQNGIAWQDILDLVKDADIDSFSRECLLQLQRYYIKQ